jgi:hypothetical protein
MASWDRIYSIRVHPGACVNFMNIQTQKALAPHNATTVQFLLGCDDGE